MNVFNSISKGLNEAIEFEKGNVKARKKKRTVAPIPIFKADQIKLLRQEMGMTQVMFAAVVGVSPKTVEAWESGKNSPDGAARRMMSILKRDPQLPIE